MSLCRGALAWPATLCRCGGPPLYLWRTTTRLWGSAGCCPLVRRYSTATPHDAPPTVKPGPGPAPAADPVNSAGDPEEPFPYEAGDEIYALAGSDGLYYPCTVQEVDLPRRHCRVVFAALPEGENVERVISFDSINKLDGDGLISTFMNNFIISEAETRRIPTENWTHASEMAWKALFSATMGTLFGFAFLVYVVYRLYIHDDPEWHVKLSRWAKGKFGVPEKDATKSISISWAELLLMLRDGEPPERVKQLISEGEEGMSGGAVFDPMDPPNSPSPSLCSTS